MTTTELDPAGVKWGPIHVTRYPSLRDTTPSYAETTWPEFVASFLAAGHRELPNKLFGELWSPIKPSPGATTSGTNTVLEVGACVLDLDHKTGDEIVAALEAVQASGLACLAHTSHSHRPEPYQTKTPEGEPIFDANGVPVMGEDQRIRLIFPLPEPIMARSFPPIWRGAARRWGGDPACKDVGRRYFLPSRQQGGDPEAHWIIAFDGRPLSASDIVVEPLAAVAPLPEQTRVLTDDILVKIANRWRRSKAIEQNDLGLRLHKILLGEAYAQPGEVDSVTWALVRGLVKAYPQIDGDAFGQRMKLSLDLMGSDALTKASSVAVKFARAKSQQIDFLVGTEERPTLLYHPAETHLAVDFALERLQEAEIYARGGVLSHVTRIDDASYIAPCGRDRIREEIGMRSSWLRGGADEQVAIGVPGEVVDALMDRADWPDIRDLIGVSSFPVLRPDGEVVSSGYDDVTKVLVAAAPVEVVSGDLPELAAELVGELAGDFPFTDETGISAWLATVLTPFCRYAFDGPTPMLVVDKAAPGTGGTLLADLIGVVATGNVLGKNTYQKGEEFEKRIMSFALAGAPFVLLDNVSRALGDDYLNQILTATQLEGRLLGSTTRLALPWRAQMIATGNNLSIRGDLARRIVYLRLNAAVERPELRTGFARASIVEWARENRGRLAGLALGIASQSIKLGPVDLPPMGSYEAWSRVVRSAVVRCGLPDPLESQNQAPTEGGDMDLLFALMAGIEHAGGHDEKSAIPIADMIDLGSRSGVLGDALREIDSTLDSRKITLRLRSLRDRRAGGKTLCAARAGASSKWFVQ